MRVVYFLMVLGIASSFQSVKNRSFLNGAEMVTMRIDAHKFTQDSETGSTCYIVQKGANIGTDNWEQLCEAIADFRYKEGYVYDVTVRVEMRTNPSENESPFKYQLVRILSKTKSE